MGSTDADPLHIAMFPWFAFGHISPFIQLSNKLSVDPTIKISFLSAPGNIPRISSSLSSTVQIIPLEIPPVDGLPAGLESTAEMTPLQTELLKKAVDNMKPQIVTLLAHLRPHIIFHDFTHQWLPSISTPLNIKTFIFSVFSAISGAYVMVPARLPSSQIPTVDDLKKPPLGFPSTSVTMLKTYEASDMLYVFKNFGGPSVYDRDVGSKKNCSAIVIKTCLEMEAPYVKFIESQYGKPVLLAGPVVPQPPTGALDHGWADWLGQFPEKSVVFCSFGSETFLKDDQIRELVLGLEMAGPPFLVVLNFPDEEDTVARLNAALPEGFKERVKDKGVVYTGWVQQQHILAHDSVGCFVCHGGLSSITEALISDCQLVLLPQKGDQFLNTRLVSGDLKAGIEVKREDENGYFGKEDLCEAVKAIMEKVDEEPGKTVRENHRKWRDFMRDAAVHEKFLKDFVKEMKRMVLGVDG
ncbi:anthocyanidin-3-O-glucoside rhamnosyltransferase-like [Magnolia sinica]|uniref:anthocyanidin-3-O-glucoside rhamnosyltransferase-like n=1 Tax=Magnolia sinica TaxID=86752 RepID=UPI00265A3135|nr:anthocyanidin-3-O-glucoside rhamnosyltransferase-like [Magnolia sinica]